MSVDSASVAYKSGYSGEVAHHAFLRQTHVRIVQCHETIIYADINVHWHLRMVSPSQMPLPTLPSTKITR